MIDRSWNTTALIRLKDTSSEPRGGFFGRRCAALFCGVNIGKHHSALPYITPNHVFGQYCQGGGVVHDQNHQRSQLLQWNQTHEWLSMYTSNGWSKSCRVLFQSVPDRRLVQEQSGSSSLLCNPQLLAWQMQETGWELFHDWGCGASVDTVARSQPAGVLWFLRAQRVVFRWCICALRQPETREDKARKANLGHVGRGKVAACNFVGFCRS